MVVPYSDYERLLKEMAELKKRNAELEALAMPPPPLTPASPPPDLVQAEEEDESSFVDEPPCLSPLVLDSLIKSLDDSFTDEPPQLDLVPAGEEPPDVKQVEVNCLKEVRVVLRRLTEEELKSYGVDLRDLAKPAYRRKRISTTLRYKKAGKLQLIGGSNQKKKSPISGKNKNRQSPHGGNSKKNEVIIIKKFN